MQYLGGKSRIGKKIAVELINPLVMAADRPYYEPFVGACNVARYVKASWRLLTDANADLIALWREVQRGWVPPMAVSEAEYAAARNDPATAAHLRAFIGFGCSFGGKWFGGYARNSRGDDYCGQARNSIAKLAPDIQSAHFEHVGYADIAPRPNAVIYCDPPYAHTTGYGSVGAFDSEAFWNKVRLWSETCDVLVSEYRAPEDFVCVAEYATKLELRSKSGREPRIERVFTYATRRNLQTNPQD